MGLRERSDVRARLTNVMRRPHDEQDVGSFGRGRLKRVSVDLPDGVSFDQYGEVNLALQAPSSSARSTTPPPTAAEPSPRR